LRRYPCQSRRRGLWDRGGSLRSRPPCCDSLAAHPRRQVDIPKASEDLPMIPHRRFSLAIALSIVAASATTLPAQVITLPTETPAKLTPTYAGFDHVRRDVMIPMRDGVKLHTVILVPKAARHAPILRSE